MQIRKSYQRVNPELLYAEVRDFVLKQGAALGEAKMETYALPDDSSTFMTRGTLVFIEQVAPAEGKQCLRAHIVGSVKSDTKLMLDVDETLFPPDKLNELQSDLDFIFGSYEVR